IRLDPKFAAAHGNLGNLLLQQDKIPAARKELEQAIRLDPNNARAHYNLGMLLAPLKEYSLAAEQFGIARKLQENDPAITFLFLRAALKANRIVEALAAA